MEKDKLELVNVSFTPLRILLIEFFKSVFILIMLKKIISIVQIKSIIKTPLY